MRSRLESLKRLVSLYGSVEAMHSTELQRRTAAVREAEQAIVAQQGALRQSSSHSRDGLNDGDRVGWKAAQVQREIAEWKQERLEQVRMERERSSEERYSEPSKANLMESIRDAESAKVAQPITTPIRIPAMKPHCRMMRMIASSET